MMFGSRDPMTFTNDFLPGESGPFGRLAPIHYPLHEANPILVRLREVSARDELKITAYLGSLEERNVWQWDAIATREQIDHARRVLDRLAVFA